MNNRYILPFYVLLHILSFHYFIVELSLNWHFWVRLISLESISPFKFAGVLASTVLHHLEEIIYIELTCIGYLSLRWKLDSL